jgi:hypothetical protein
MPEFRQYDVSVDVDVDISVDEFLDACDKYEIEEVIEWLSENAVSKEGTVLFSGFPNLNDLEWNSVISTLAKSRLRLSNEDEEIIKAIAKKL